MTFPDVIASHNYQEHHIKHALTPTEESRDPGMVSMIALGMEGELMIKWVEDSQLNPIEKIHISQRAKGQHRNEKGKAAEKVITGQRWLTVSQHQLSRPVFSLQKPSQNNNKTKTQVLRHACGIPALLTQNVSRDTRNACKVRGEGLA